MSTETAVPKEERLREKHPEVTSVFAVMLGSFVVFTGAVVVFASSPVTPVEPAFNVSPWEPVSVLFNMVLGISIGAAGVSMAIPELDSVLEPFSS